MDNVSVQVGSYPEGDVARAPEPPPSAQAASPEPSVTAAKEQWPSC